ncbi:MAG TPA: TonB-dependent receptor, partial [Candidatus Krumholzibacteria bacterium]|nr:TonB-dependent receptor [Candidatus Krumholzibacteria bacterium]
IGRGRSRLLVNGIPLNDPQDGRAPFAHVATSGLYTLSLDAPVDQVYAPGIEGALSMHELVAPRARPNTVIDLSKGSNQVRQRRVRFGSQAGSVGLDVTYDEVLDDGYDFDAYDFIFGPDAPKGRARSRNVSISLRGDLPDDAGYTIGVRRFDSSSIGDLQNVSSEAIRRGHLVWATAGVNQSHLTVYGRGYNASRPDSSTENETVGGVVSWNPRRGGNALHVFALGEHTNAIQNVGRGDIHTRATEVNAGVSTEAVAGTITWFAHGIVAGDEDSRAWGAGGGARRALPGGDLSLSAQRSFRMPTIGERYLPLHDHYGLMLSGNPDLDPETSWEADADWTLHAGAFTNRVRGAWIQSRDYVAYAPVAGDSLARRPANMDGTPSMTFLDERLHLGAMLGSVELRGDAGGTLSSGDRTGAFRSVPRVQVNASLLCGMQLFEKTSALYLGGEYAFVDNRLDYDGEPLSSYQVVNVMLLGRLIDAHVYVKWLNVLDERYQTVWGYLMTPRTLAYGIEWTLFD